MFYNSYHLKNYQQEVWSLINKFESFNIKCIPRTKNYDTDMLINMVSSLNIYDKKFSIEICRPLIPSTNWRISNDDKLIIEHLQSEYISKGSIINGEQHEALLQAPISDEKPKFRDSLSNHIIRLENHFGLQDTFKRTMNRYLQWKLRKIYSSLE